MNIRDGEQQMIGFSRVSCDPKSNNDETRWMRRHTWIRFHMKPPTLHTIQAGVAWKTLAASGHAVSSSVAGFRAAGNQTTWEKHQQSVGKE